MALKKPSFAILTPVWNGLPYIKECVDSVLLQDYQDWELIISDNGSTDKTREYLDTLTDPRIRVYKQEKNLGIAGNLNFLLAKVFAPVAHILCADDYFYPGAIGKILHEWESRPANTAFIGFNWKKVIEHSIQARYSHSLLPKKLDPQKSQLAFFLFGNMPGNLSNVTCDVEIVKATGGFNVGLKQACDFEIWARITRSKSMILSDTDTVYVRMHEHAATNYLNKQGRLFAEHIAIYEKLVEQLSTYIDRKKLIDYFNIEMCSFHLRHAIKAIFLGELANIKMYLGTESSIFWPPWKRFFVCLPFALYETGRMHLLVSMARKLWNENQELGPLPKSTTNVVV
ncbi:MAG TPA: glycosyltransferase family A protein [Chryseolinea sp.]|nr:glycosyltransferase family A protein [Chryseolinea sp.]